MSCPYFSCINKRAKTANVTFETKNKGNIPHLAIYFTGLKVYDEFDASYTLG
ncbi:Mobile element protein [Candidatus Enterovibrio altilux]|uniref:Mobile element protein n=1 Tax=Candidatus Enterovibrio altilux TaxID=1927128 RepID=A0A291B6M1_9GAMM|nr:Mobile element protein [Candidatus Enterovibrio luxaltus]